MAKSKTKKNTKRMAHPRSRATQPNRLTAVEMRNLSSDLIRDLSYSNGDLVVSMRNGARYRYPSVDGELVQDFLAAASFGRFFNDHIRHLRFERLDS